LAKKNAAKREWSAAFKELARDLRKNPNIVALEENKGFDWALARYDAWYGYKLTPVGTPPPKDIEASWAAKQRANGIPV
jgi:endonuclease/exonuclease/phosphatase (EEP) superfamily protein YafD